MKSIGLRLVALALALTVGSAVLPVVQAQPPLSQGGARVLIVPDKDDGPNVPELAALSGALTSAGFVVTQRPAPHTDWDGTNPPVGNFDVVIHLTGSSNFPVPLQDSACAALESFVQNGGGYIGAQWNGYLRYSAGTQVPMTDLILQIHDYNDNHSGPETYTVVSGQGGHPVLAGIPNSFTFNADWVDSAAAVVFGTDPSTVLMTSLAGNPGVIARQFGAGKVVSFSFVPMFENGGFTMMFDTNIQKLYVNSVNWAFGGPSGPSISSLKIQIQALMTAGTLARSLGSTLLSLLDSAQLRVTQGRNASAITLLRQFITYVQRSTLPAASKTALINDANAVIAALTGP